MDIPDAIPESLAATLSQASEDLHASGATPGRQIPSSVRSIAKAIFLLFTFLVQTSFVQNAEPDAGIQGNIATYELYNLTPVLPVTYQRLDLFGYLPYFPFILTSHFNFNRGFSFTGAVTVINPTSPLPETTPVPEPSTLLLLGTSLSGFAGYALRRRRVNRTARPPSGM